MLRFHRSAFYSTTMNGASCSGSGGMLEAGSRKLEVTGTLEGITRSSLRSANRRLSLGLSLVVTVSINGFPHVFVLTGTWQLR